MGVWFARLLCFEISMKFTLRKSCPFCVQSLDSAITGMICPNSHYLFKQFEQTIDEYYIQKDSIFTVFYNLKKNKLDFRVSSLYIDRADHVPIETFTKQQSFEQIREHLNRANRLAVMR